MTTTDAYDAAQAAAVYIAAYDAAYYAGAQAAYDYDADPAAYDAWAQAEVIRADDYAFAARAFADRGVVAAYAAYAAYAARAFDAKAVPSTRR